MRFRYRLIITIALLIALSFGIGGTVLIAVSFHASLEEKTNAAFNSYMSVRNTLFLLNSLGEQTNYEGMVMALEGIEGPWEALRVKLNGNLLFQSEWGWKISDALPQPEPEQYGYMHLHDVRDGTKDHQALGTGELDIFKYLDLAKERDISVVVETKTIAGLRQSAKWLREHL